MTRILSLEVLQSYRIPLLELGCTWILDRRVGTLTATLDSRPVLTALKHPSGLWLVRFIDRSGITWSPECPCKDHHGAPLVGPRDGSGD